MDDNLEKFIIISEECGFKHLRSHTFEKYSESEDGYDSYYICPLCKYSIVFSKDDLIDRKAKFSSPLTCTEKIIKSIIE